MAFSVKQPLTISAGAFGDLEEVVQSRAGIDFKIHLHRVDMKDLPIVFSDGDSGYLIMVDPIAVTTGDDGRAVVRLIPSTYLPGTRYVLTGKMGAGRSFRYAFSMPDAPSVVGQDPLIP